MPQYSLPQREKAFLTLEIKGKTYNIPLGKNLTFGEVRKLMKLDKMDQDAQLDFYHNFLAKYMGEEFVDELEFVEIMDIFNLWKKANDEAGGLDLGEYLASQGS